MNPITFILLTFLAQKIFPATTTIYDYSVTNVTDQIPYLHEYFTSPVQSKVTRYPYKKLAKNFDTNKNINMDREDYEYSQIHEKFAYILTPAAFTVLACVIVCALLICFSKRCRAFLSRQGGPTGDDEVQSSVVSDSDESPKTEKANPSLRLSPSSQDFFAEITAHNERVKGMSTREEAAGTSQQFIDFLGPHISFTNPSERGSRLDVIDFGSLADGQGFLTTSV